MDIQSDQKATLTNPVQDPEQFPVFLDYVATIGATGQKIVDLLVAEGTNKTDAVKVVLHLLSDIGVAVAAGDFDEVSQ